MPAVKTQWRDPGWTGDSIVDETRGISLPSSSRMFDYRHARCTSGSPGRVVRWRRICSCSLPGREVPIAPWLLCVSSDQLISCTGPFSSVLSLDDCVRGNLPCVREKKEVECLIASLLREKLLSSFRLVLPSLAGLWIKTQVLKVTHEPRLHEGLARTSPCQVGYQS